MKTKILLLSGVVAVGAATYYAMKTHAPSPQGTTQTLNDAVAQKSKVMKEGNRCQFSPGWHASYDYAGTTESKIAIQGMHQPVDAIQEWSAKLALELLESPAPGEWVLLGQFSELNETLEKIHGSAWGSPFLVKVGSACDVKGFARLNSVSKKVAQAQQVVMHDLFVKFPEGSSGETTFENGTGLARADFARDSNGATVTRTIKTYEMAWRVSNTFNVTESYARATLDKHWIEEFKSREGISGGLVNSAVSTFTLKKHSGTSMKVAASGSRALGDYSWENLLSGVFTETTVGSTTVANVPAAEQRYVEAMKNSNLEEAFSGLLNKVEEKANIEEQWHEMAGYLNGHPEKIADFAHGLSQSDFPEQAKAVSYLVLSKTAHPQARDALMALRSSPQLNVGDRTRASLALVVRKDVGMELARELKRDALEDSSEKPEGDFSSRNSLLQLGILAGAHKDNREVVDFARDAVSGQLASAAQDTALLSPALGAAGNLGDVRLLSSLVAYSRNPDYRVRVLVPKSLRGYAYAETESIFVDWLARETHPDVKEEIFDILYHQLAQAQRKAGPGVVREAIKHLQMKPMAAARQSIVHLIGPLKDKYPEAKAVLIEQVPEEFRNRSGIFDQIARYLAPQELELALSRMPEFAHQYGPDQQANAARAVVELEQQLSQTQRSEAP